MQPPSSPPWPDESRGPKLIAVTWTLYIFVIAVFSFRVYTRLRPVRHIGWDDITVTVAFLSLTAQMGLLIARVKNGLGRHNYYVPPAQVKKAMRWLIIGQLLWLLCLGMCKISVAMMFLRLKQERRWKLFLYSSVFLIVAITVACYIMTFLQCRPVAALWDPTIRGAKCWAPEVSQLCIIAINIFMIATDVMFSVLPVTFIRQLNRPLREKIVVCFLMGLGLVGSVASIIKTVQLNHFGMMNDSLWIGVNLEIWSFLEQQLGIIAVSLPCLKSAFEHAMIRFGLLPSLSARTSRHAKGYTDYSREHFGMDTLSQTSQRYTRQEIVGDGKSEELILPSKPAELTRGEFVKIPERAIKRQPNIQDSWDMDMAADVVA